MTMLPRKEKLLVKRASRETGFTLVELLVALTLVALLMLMLFGGFRLGARTWETTQSRGSDISKVVAVQNFLRQQLSVAHDVPVSAEGASRDLIAFEGEPESVTFVATLPSHIALPGLYRLTLRTEPRDGSRQALIVSWSRFQDAQWQNRSSDDIERVLVENVEEVTFAFFGVQQEESVPGWYDRWPLSENLPHLVRIDISPPPGEPIVWPQLVIALAYADIS